MLRRDGPTALVVLATIGCASQTGPPPENASSADRADTAAKEEPPAWSDPEMQADVATLFVEPGVPETAASDAPEPEDDQAWVRCRPMQVDPSWSSTRRAAFEEKESLKRKVSAGTATDRDRSVLRGLCRHFGDGCCPR